jgi:hypothetical protein
MRWGCPAWVIALPMPLRPPAQAFRASPARSSPRRYRRSDNALAPRSRTVGNKATLRTSPRARRRGGMAELALQSKITRLALGLDEAAEALGVSRDFFDEHVRPEVRIVRRGRRVFVAVKELERWLDRSATAALE